MSLTKADLRKVHVAVSSSAFLESLRKKGVEVRFMIYKVGECAVQQFKESDGKELDSTTKECFTYRR